MKFSLTNLNSEQSRSLSDFFVNVATAWLVAGVVTPIFTKTPLTVTVVLDILLGMEGAGAFLVLALRVFRKGSL